MFLYGIGEQRTSQQMDFLTDPTVQMGERELDMHQIMYLDFSTRKSEKTITRECARIADIEGDYTGQIQYCGIRFNDVTLKDDDTARKWIDSRDNGWYDNIAVKYMDGRKKKWLVKIEFHC